MKTDQFRAWDKKRNEWYGASNPHSLTFVDFALFGECTMICTPLVEDLQHLEITQWTGLLDKNGKKIYGGDWIKIYFNESSPIREVEWYESGWYVNLNDFFPATAFFPSLHYFEEIDNEIEVVGNKFEHPEMLKD